MGSSIPTKQLDGDVSVGRNVAVGGKADVKGSMTVGHNLKVDGWLEAKNIKGPNKGLFKTAEQLRIAYPNPHDGWWALVGDTLPAPIYRGDGGEWVATGKEGGNPTVDSSEYMAAVEQLTEDINAVKSDVKENKEDIKNLRSTQTTMGDQVNNIQKTANGAATAADKAQKTADKAQTNINEFKNTKGEAGGIAQLDESRNIPEDNIPTKFDNVIDFYETDSGIIAQLSAIDKSSSDENCTVVYNEDSNCFVLCYHPADAEALYYNEWLDGRRFGVATSKGRQPEGGKIYTSTISNKCYHWNGKSLVLVGSDISLGYTEETAFPGSDGKQLQSTALELGGRLATVSDLQNKHQYELIARNTINTNDLLGLNDRAVTFSVILEKIADLDNAISYMKPGVVLSFITENGWQNKQWTNAGKKTAEDWKKESNWTDFGSNGSSIGNTVNVNDLCGDTQYTLSTAIKAVQDFEQESGLSYFKTGVVLTFKTTDTTSNGSPLWKAYQYTRGVDDINPADEKPWMEFGGGSNSKVSCTDEPTKDSKEPYSSGGAYRNTPTDIHLNADTEGVVKLQLTNAEGNGIGNEVAFAVGTGSGGDTSGTIVTVQCEQSPLYSKAGGSIIINASVRSITMQGKEELSNMIEKVILKDRDTNQVLETFIFNRASSATSDTYDFAMDVSSYFQTAITKRFQLVAYDDSGNTGSRNINVSGVDVTVSSAQTLNYTASTALAVGGASKKIPLYKFANNASDKGIRCITEILINGEWKELGTSIVLDTYQHDIVIDPKNCCDTQLTHGSYPLRIHGEDVGSGVVGNYLHTAVMVVEEGNNTPIVATRWYTDTVNGKRKLYEYINIDYAIYQADNDEPKAIILYDGKPESTNVAYRQSTNIFTKQVLENVHDGSKTIDIYVECGDTASQVASFNIDGSLVDVEEVSTQREFNILMDSRNNSEEDKTIKDGQTEITVEECNWSSNGFVKDTYGTPSYGTDNDNGRMALRIAEDMKAECSFKPFASNSIEQNGMAISFTLKVKNVEDRTARLIDCLGENQLGFYLTGEKLVFTCDGATSANPDDLGAQQTAIALYATDKETRFDIVIEPSSIAPYSGIGNVKIFVNGDFAAACYYNAGKFQNSEQTIKFDGTKADIYLYKITGWATYYNYRQALNNYLVGLKDTSAMLSEYNKNQVMASQTAEGTTKDRPTLQACQDAGLCCVTLLKNANTPDIPSSYPGYLDTLDGDKKTKAYYDWVIRFPNRPWQDCIVYNVPTVNQGTTSSLRPVKNNKGKFKGCKIVLLHKEEDFKNDPVALAKFKMAEKMAAKSKIQVIDGGLWVRTITIKVDYSDSTGANNGAMMELMNKTQRALGSDYMTPAQNAYKGEGTMNTSIDSVSCALFRTDAQSIDATNETYAYFHAKANFNVDKGNPDFFGFEKVDGYNSTCLNYGDFVELVAEKGQDINVFKALTLGKSEELIASNIYMLSEYCGPKNIFLENDGTGSMTETDAVAETTDIDKTLSEVLADDVASYDWGTVYHTSDDKYAKYVGGNWKDTTGKMSWDKSTKQWVVTGRTLNPVECFEYLKYDSFCWLKGVKSVEDLMRIDPATGEPVWLSYYESRYPDDDDLNDLYAKGKKVPYNLFKWLEWTQQCSQDLNEDDGDITLHGKTVSGTKENRLKKWCEELHEHANVRSTLCYVVGSDYCLAVDQRSKNMMVAFYLDTNGIIRAYFNHWYDGDCVWLADNDCGITIPWDLDSKDDPKHFYQGWNSVMFQQSYRGDKFWLEDNAQSAITLHDVAADMRKAEADGIKIFSADGCTKIWITDRISKYAKVISSFDGERKYIENSKAGANYFYAVHGLRMEDLPVTFKKRFAYRDGFYQVGELYKNPFKMRATGTQITIKIKAAQDGFFGIGVDRADACVDSCYLKAGESYTLKSGMTSTGSGTMLYVFGAERLAVLDVSGCTPKAEGFDISNCTMLQEIILGGESYTPDEGTGAITQLDLGNKSFLRRMDIRNTKITGVVATYCPRLREVRAEGSQLASIDIAETAPITTLALPSTMTRLYFKNLPKLEYPGGLSFERIGNVKDVFISGCDKIDSTQLLLDALKAGSKIRNIGLSDLYVYGESTVLQSLIDSGSTGLDVNGNSYGETGKCSGLTGTWIMKDFVTDELIKTFKAYFPKLQLYNSQYSTIMFDDTEDDSQNITNMDNSTGYKFNNEYQKSGHFAEIESRSHAYRCKLESDGKLHAKPVSDSNYTQFANGESFDPNDNSGTGYDLLKLIPRYWYKGVNDFKNQKKYMFGSSNDKEHEPISTAKVVKRYKLSELLVKEHSAIYTTGLKKGDVAPTLQENSANGTYRVSVDGMKQVRWPGLNDATIGGVFLDAEEKVAGTFNMSVSHAQFDFVLGDYVFCDVPVGAKTFLFASPDGFADTMVLTTDSSAIEAIEPDWVWHEQCMVGVYGMTSDGIKRARSVSGVRTQRGDGTKQTSAEWKVDAEGELVNASIPATLHYTYADMLFLCRMRGSGFHSISYEQSKDIANLVMALYGDRDIQALCGSGCSADYTTGSYNFNSYGNVTRIGTPNGQGNIIFGLQNFVACMWEIMDHVAVNVKTYYDFRKNKYVEKGDEPVDIKWHIYDPYTGEERIVQGRNISGYCVGRVKFGRFCDIIMSRETTDNSKFVLNYSDGQWYTHSRCRALGRSHSSASAGGGLVYLGASYASSDSGAYNGARLAFSGEIVFDDELQTEKA